MRLSALFASRSPVDPRGARRSRTPLCNPDDALRRSCDASLGQAPAALPAIDLDPEGQVALWKAWRPFVRELALRRDRMPAPSSSMSAGPFGENIVLSCMLQHAKPRRFVAYGAPGAIATALGTMETGANQSMECIYLAPSPDLSSRVLRPADRPRIRIVPGASPPSTKCQACSQGWTEATFYILVLRREKDRTPSIAISFSRCCLP
jgi:hypothetical protein